MSCDPHRDELILLLDPELAHPPERELDPAELAVLRAHLQSCTSCQDELIRLTLALTAALEEPAPRAPVLAAPALASPAGTDPAFAGHSFPDVRPPRPESRFRRSARAAALAESLPRLRAESSREDGPSQIAGYEVLAELGRGGVGVVYHARSPAGEEVALKVCLGLTPRHLERHRRASDRIRGLLSSRTSPRLAGPLASILWEHEGETLWVEVLPLLRGPSLEDLLQEGRCDPHEATEIAVEVARALRDAHAAGLVLRDLKPRDVFLEAEGLRVLVPGPSFETSENQLTCSGAFLGTPYYLSPEQILGKHPDERSDLFALGAIYHELLTGAPPNKGARTAVEIFQARVAGDLPEPSQPEVSADQKKVLARLLAADPERRYLDAGEALGDLLLVSEDLPIEREDPSWEQVVRLRPRPSKTKASAIALLGLVALAALIALAYFFR